MGGGRKSGGGAAVKPRSFSVADFFSEFRNSGGGPVKARRSGAPAGARIARGGEARAARLAARSRSAGRSAADGGYPDGEGVAPRSEAVPSANFFQPIEAGLPLDLFGQPFDRCEGRKGRPRHLPTPATRALVAQLHVRGETQAAIAEALGITRPTLRLNYPVELGSRSVTWKRRSPPLTQKGD